MEVENQVLCICLRPFFCWGDCIISINYVRSELDYGRLRPVCVLPIILPSLAKFFCREFVSKC